MISKRLLKNLIIGSIFLFLLLITSFVHIINSKFNVTGQEQKSVFSVLPENFRSIFINDQSSALSSTDVSISSPMILDLSKIEQETLSINVLEDLPRGSTRIEDVDNQNKGDILVNSSELNEIENIIDSKSGINQI